MRLVVLAALAALGCGGTRDRERDCAEVRKVLAQRIPARATDDQGNGFVDMSPYTKLRELSYRDTAVRDAAHNAAIDIATDVYSPGPHEGAPRSVDRLATLCGLSRAQIVSP